MLAGCTGCKQPDLSELWNQPTLQSGFGKLFATIKHAVEIAVRTRKLRYTRTTSPGESPFVFERIPMFCKETPCFFLVEDVDDHVGSIREAWIRLQSNLRGPPWSFELSSSSGPRHGSDLWASSARAIRPPGVVLGFCDFSFFLELGLEHLRPGVCCQVLFF